MYAIHTGKVPDTRILDEYSRVRIQKWQETINPMSRKNFGLIWDPALEQDREAFFAFTKKMDEDKELAKQMAHVSPITVPVCEDISSTDQVRSLRIPSGRISRTILHKVVEA